ncbi:ABC transporter substrate-binding protein [Sulfobacillus thermosulfidooxidans]|uniref:ABC transporter substrate-binding protein n=1 Tax=Sulfobacillus thermosulfidooxidans TaxID=28034 RepID=UPI00096B9E4A|nr:ABC transporter substrate-binding protein [Sulfobacillus thermosulfidooxidans]OLZ11376.1 ABC transporter substrate-binding protein [Sulfobacillus thermosulfidooxidans]OLZ14026.1 ABC transporter substrate-binding protein [Sulfobacillus thermosulfidooxidans]OLZ19882.1 ABC transporter substrate-binding protein [Sulfobacillus thermosulfidooxidans]
MKKRSMLALTIIPFVMMATAAGCGSAQATVKATNNQPLVVIPGLQPAFLDNFNPFSSSALTGTLGLIYEPLYYFNTAGPQVYPLLATSYTWSHHNTVLTVNLRPGVMWSNDKPMTVQDVVYSYDILKQFPALDVNAVWTKISSVSALNAHQVQFVFKTADVPYLETLLGSIYIVPKSVWSHVANPAQYTNPKPIGTGPYLLKSFNQETVTFVANPHYWGGEPKVKTVEYLDYTGNESATLALTSGKIDWTGLFIPHINKVFVSKDPAHNHYWFSPSGPLMLYPNLKDPLLSQLPVREAISYGINRTQLWKEGEYGYEKPATTPTSLALPLESAWLPSNLAVNKVHLSYDPAKAEKILTQAGYHKNSQGIFVSPQGQPLEFTLEVPTGWTDWDTDCSLMANQLQAIGIKVTVQQEAFGTYYSNLSTGHYQLAMSWTDMGATPYYLYKGLLGPNNWEQWSNSVTTQDLEKFKTSSSPQQQHQAIDQIAEITARQLPAIPLLYGVNWYEYNDSAFTGWPNANNPYAAPQPWTTPAEAIVITHLKPRG